jgi:hypothetical protein
MINTLAAAHGWLLGKVAFAEFVSSLPRWVRLSHSMRSNKPTQAQQITSELPP